MSSLLGSADGSIALVHIGQAAIPLFHFRRTRTAVVPPGSSSVPAFTSLVSIAVALTLTLAFRAIWRSAASAWATGSRIGSPAVVSAMSFPWRSFVTWRARVAIRVGKGPSSSTPAWRSFIGARRRGITSSLAAGGALCPFMSFLSASKAAALRDFFAPCCEFFLALSSPTKKVS
jgi:hypothetical protein